MPRDPQRRAILALALLVPAPTLGALAAFVFFPGPVGQGIYFACKVWLVVLPVVWRLWVDRERLSLSPLAAEHRRRGVATGIALGLVLFGVILIAWEVLGRAMVDPERLAEAVYEAGLGTPVRYVAFAVYLIVINSLVEEYVWRWFVFEQCERLARPWSAVVLAGLFFTAHHTVTFAVQFAPATAGLASLGVFTGGCAWSWCYLRFRSIWPGWISHAFADVAGLWVGWGLLFSSG